VVGQLADVSDDLEPVMRDLRPAVAETRGLFDALPGALKAADPLLKELKPFSGKLQPAIGALDTFLRQASPAVGYLSPFSKEIATMFANNGDVFALKDAVGNFGRVHVMTSYSSLTAFSPELRKAMEALTEVGAFGVYDSNQTNGYPKPGTVGKPDESSDFRRVESR